MLTLDGAAFQIFTEQFLIPNLWSGAVVVMDRLAIHQMASVVRKIQSVGARVVDLSPYSPDFNPIELVWSQLKSFLRSFAPKNSATIDSLLAIALHFINPHHLRNWFAHCCYCTS